MSFKEYISDSTLSRMSASVSNKEVPTPQEVITNEGKRGRNTKEYSNLEPQMLPDRALGQSRYKDNREESSLQLQSIDF